MNSHPIHRRAAARCPRISTVAALALAAAAALVATPLQAADTDPCKGRSVRALGGSHAVSQKPIRDLADLQKRLPMLEDGMREAILKDPSLSPETVDALFAAIRSGAVSERKLDRKESMKWMIYKPQPGKLDVIQQPCVNLNRDYEAFEITVDVAEPEVAAQEPSRCQLAVTRNCEQQNPTITVDATGSSSNARVEHGGVALSGQGPRWTVPDAAPCSKDEDFVVRAQAPATKARMARVHRFVIPKACSNLAYIAEAPAKTLSAGVAPAACEKSVTAAQCTPWASVSVDPTAVEVHNPATVKSGSWTDCSTSLEAVCAETAEPIALDATGTTTYTPGKTCCGADGYDLRLQAKNATGGTTTASTPLTVTPHDWTFRPALAYYMPMGDAIERDIDLPFGRSGRETFEVDDGLGISLALEKRMNARWGLEGAFLAGITETSYELTTGGETGEDTHNANFYALTIGPNFHLLKCTPDLYFGLFVGYGGIADPNYWVFDHHFRASFDGRFIWGAQLGLDVPFSPVSDWGFHGGLRYFALAQDTDAGEIDIDPLVLEAGLSYKF